MALHRSRIRYSKKIEYDDEQEHEHEKTANAIVGSAKLAKLPHRPEFVTLSAVSCSVSILEFHAVR